MPPLPKPPTPSRRRPRSDERLTALAAVRTRTAPSGAVFFGHAPPAFATLCGTTTPGGRMNLRSILSAAGVLGAAFGAQALSITSLTPQGEVAQVRQVVAKFDGSAVTFGDPKAPAPFSLSCSDAQATAGNGRWISDRAHRGGAALPAATFRGGHAAERDGQRLVRAGRPGRARAGAPHRRRGARRAAGVAGAGEGGGQRPVALRCTRMRPALHARLEGADRLWKRCGSTASARTPRPPACRSVRCAWPSTPRWHASWPRGFA